jgi:hypothetical protein
MLFTVRLSLPNDRALWLRAMSVKHYKPTKSRSPEQTDDTSI